MARWQFHAFEISLLTTWSFIQNFAVTAAIGYCGRTWLCIAWACHGLSFDFDSLHTQYLIRMRRLKLKTQWVGTNLCHHHFWDPTDSCTVYSHRKKLVPLNKKVEKREKRREVRLCGRASQQDRGHSLTSTLSWFLLVVGSWTLVSVKVNDDFIDMNAW